jgi:DNA-binding NtrC family response regulator
MRAQRCYEMSRFAPDAFHPKTFCKQTCDECDYYKEVLGQKTNVLVVTDNSKLANNLLDQAEKARFNIEVADCEYSCSMAVNHFKPDFAVVDCSLGHEASRDITRHLVEDPRVPFVRVVLAANDGEFPNECDEIVFARLERPFDIDDIDACIDGALVKERPDMEP